MTDPLPDNVVHISSHRKWRNRAVLANAGVKQPRPPESTAPTQTEHTHPIALLFKAISERLIDLHVEGKDQRTILREVCHRLAQLKQSIDQLIEERKQ